VVPALLLAAAALGDASPGDHAAISRSASAEERTLKVGMIFIIGNEDTTTSLILDHLALYPGETVCDRDLRQAERRLARLGAFVVDPAKGVRPHLREERDGDYTNIWVEVKEKKKARCEP
jgi:outer membrane protein assembly factor BamA